MHKTRQFQTQQVSEKNANRESEARAIRDEYAKEQQLFNEHQASAQKEEEAKKRKRLENQDAVRQQVDARKQQELGACYMHGIDAKLNTGLLQQLREAENAAAPIIVALKKRKPF